jgi:hypothetical protein
MQVTANMLVPDFVEAEFGKPVPAADRKASSPPSRTTIAISSVPAVTASCTAI